MKLISFALLAIISLPSLFAFQAHDQNLAYTHPAIVVSGGVSYISVQNVPSGTPISNTTYWQGLLDTTPTEEPGDPPTTEPDDSNFSNLTPPETDEDVTKLINISTRGYVGTGSDVLIGGFVISGDQNKTVLVRTLGPSLASQGVSGSLADPFVYVVNQANPTVIVGSNDNWSSATGIDAIVGTIFEPGDEKDSAMILTLEPGAYTAIVQGINSTTGVALIEVNEFDELDSSRLINISTRGYVGTGSDVLIGGFVISGDQNKTVLVRTLGPSLASQGVSGSISDPFVYVVNQANPTVIVGSNDNWSSATGIDAIVGTIFEPGDEKDSAMILTLEPGAYTAIVQGINSTTGVALIEVNDFD